MKDALLAPESYPCRECQAGKVWLNYITYFTWLGDELITVPNFPAWVCDVCGRREYDERAIGWLTALLNPDAGKPPARRTRPARRAPGKAASPRPPSE
jgi:YgiT-type zinc finger domain-containing protein